MADKTPQDILKEAVETAEILKDAFTSLGASIKSQLTANLMDADDYTKQYIKSLKYGVGSLISSLGKSGDKLIDNQLKLNKGQLSSKDISKQLEELESKKFRSLNQVLIARKNEWISSNESRKLYNQINVSIEEGKKGLEDQAKAALKIENNVGVLGKAVKGLNKIPILGNLIESEKVLADIQEAAAKKGANRLTTLGVGLTSIGKSIGKNLIDPLTVFTFFMNSAFKADKQVTELAKSLGIGKDQANGLRENFVRYSAATEDTFITTNKLLEAQGDLTNELGIAVQYTGKQTEDFTRLTKLMGLSANEAGKLARLSIINGTSIEATAKSIIKGSAASQRSNKISIDQRTILKDVSNLSAGILVKFQGNPEALGAAVVQARALGLTLEEVDKIGESLLNFESSIENELKAELITGKQLNLERARAAALTGDQAALMQEVASQMGTLEEFQNLNVIAQKSLAEAFGLSRDEVSKMLIEQEKVNKLGDVSKMTLDQQLKALKAQGEPLDSVLYKQIQQQSAQEKFNNAIEKLQDIVGNLVAGPFGRLLDIIASIVSNTTALSSIMAIYVGKQIFSLSLAASAFLLARRTAKMTAVDAAAEVAKNAAKIPYVGWTLAIGAGLATFAALSGLLSEGNDVVSEGYGKRMLLDKGSITAFNDNDTIVAGTNLGGGTGGRGSIDLTPMIAAINEVKAAITQLGSRPSIAYINGKDAFSKDVSTTSVQNTYKLA